MSKGYIVTDKYGPLLFRVNPYRDGGAALVRKTGRGTVFPSRQAAWNAIRRTRTYVRRRPELQWPMDHHVHRLEEA